MPHPLSPTISIAGCGWLGEPLAKHLIAHGHTVNGSTTSPEKMAPLMAAGIEPFILQLDDTSTYTPEFFDCDILIVCIPSKDVQGFSFLARQAERSHIKKIIYISSTSVYPADGGVVTEDSPLTDSPLVEIENLFREKESFQTTVIRFAGLIGPGRNPAHFFKGGRVVPNPEGVVNLIHLDDCIGIIQAVIEKEAWDEVFNGCAPSHPTRREFYTKMRMDAGLEVPEFDDISIINSKEVSEEKAGKDLSYGYKIRDLMALDHTEFGS